MNKRLLLFCCLFLSLVGKVLGQNCTPPTIELYQGTEILSPCSPSDVVKLKIYGSTASYTITSISIYAADGDIMVIPWDPGFSGKPVEADVILNPLDAESGSATVKV